MAPAPTGALQPETQTASQGLLNVGPGVRRPAQREADPQFRTGVPGGVRKLGVRLREGRGFYSRTDLVPWPPVLEVRAERVSPEGTLSEPWTFQAPKMNSLYFVIMCYFRQ